MKLSCHRVKNLSYILIDEFFDTNELVDIVQEIKDLKRFSLPASKTYTVADQKGFRKTGEGLFLDELYAQNRSASGILTYNRKIFTPELTDYAEQFDSFFGFIRESNYDSCLLNYYTSGQEYRPHKDESRISIVTFLKQGNFTGGEFIFSDQDHVIEPIHNRAVIFPSCAMHGALPIEGQGTRISIAQFIDFKNNDC
jgi:Rps23 Pro-64 3,4-dihydroxylase Tpa1-like proline 4-hydroxylase